MQHCFPHPKAHGSQSELKGFNFLLSLLELPLLLIQLGLEFGQPLAEFADFSGLRLSTPGAHLRAQDSRIRPSGQPVVPKTRRG